MRCLPSSRGIPNLFCNLNLVFSANRGRPQDYSSLHKMKAVTHRHSYVTITYYHTITMSLCSHNAAWGVQMSSGPRFPLQLSCIDHHCFLRRIGLQHKIRQDGWGWAKMSNPSYANCVMRLGWLIIRYTCHVVQPSENHHTSLEYFRIGAELKPRSQSRQGQTREVATTLQQTNPKWHVHWISVELKPQSHPTSAQATPPYVEHREGSKELLVSDASDASCSVRGSRL